jgi:hypothetical protein
MPAAPSPRTGPHDSTPTVASASRVYDFFLGGPDNYAVDQVAASFILRAFPWTGVLAKSNRHFMQRAVRYMTGEGIDQFLDLGSGLPTMGNVHEIAQTDNPKARVVYVDYERYAADKGRQILADNQYATEIFADFMNPDSILNNEEVRDLLDFSKPIGLLMASMLHFVGHETGPYRIVEKFKQPLASGSIFALSHGSWDGMTENVRLKMSNLQQAYNLNVAENTFTRSVSEIMTFYYRWNLIDPGLVLMPDWHPDEPGYEPDPTDEARMVMYAGAARKP